MPKAELFPYAGELSDGAWLGVPMSVYRAHPALSSSEVRLVLESPLTYWRIRNGVIPGESTAEMDYGTAGHGVILQGSTEDFHIHPDKRSDGGKWTKQANECKDWHAAHEDKPAISASEANRLLADRDYVRNHVRAQNLFSGGDGAQFEVTLICGKEKARLDLLTLFGEQCEISDLKIVSDASTEALIRVVLNRTYHIQLAWYRRVARALGFNPVRLNLIALQKGTKPLLNVREVPASALRLGDQRIEEALSLLARCEASGVWPDFADDDLTESIKPVELPAYAYPEEELQVGEETIAL